MVACCRTSSTLGRRPVEGPACESVCLTTSREGAGTLVSVAMRAHQVAYAWVFMSESGVSRATSQLQQCTPYLGLLSSTTRQPLQSCQCCTSTCGQADGTSSCAQQQHADCSVGSCAGASELNALSWFSTCRVTCTTTREEIHCARLGRFCGRYLACGFPVGARVATL